VEVHAEQQERIRDEEERMQCLWRGNAFETLVCEMEFRSNDTVADEETSSVHRRSSIWDHARDVDAVAHGMMFTCGPLLARVTAQTLWESPRVDLMMLV